MIGLDFTQATTSGSNDLTVAGTTSADSNTLSGVFGVQSVVSNGDNTATFTSNFNASLNGSYGIALTQSTGGTGENAVASAEI